MADQMALTRPVRGGLTTNPNRAVRQQIPAFLNKLYTMVNDPTTNDLIRWSDEGDSFFVPNHERFGKELLPKFFKHGNFSSFVRQLNMYGFHKVPHLQQGVLQNETENELWQFVSPHFQRDQPDLLMLIQRKKANPGGAAIGALPAPSPDDKDGGGAGPDAPPSSSSRAVDVSAIASSLAAIKRHQTAISDELKDLQQSNSQLWREAMEARERHKKHQDTINRILKFLAGIFTNNGAGIANSAMVRNHNEENLPRSSPESGSGSSVALVPRKRPRLMIEDSNSGSDVQHAVATNGKDNQPMNGAQLEEADDALWADEHLLVPMDMDETHEVNSPAASTPRIRHWRAASQPRIESVATSPTPSSVPPTPAATTVGPSQRAPAVPSSSTTSSSYPFPPNTDMTVQPSVFDYNAAQPTSFSTAMVPNPGPNTDVNSDTAFQALLNDSPGSFQRLMTSMSQPGGLPILPNVQQDMSMGQYGPAFNGTANPMDFMPGAPNGQFASMQHDSSSFTGGQLISATPNPFQFLPQPSAPTSFTNFPNTTQVPNGNHPLSSDDMMALLASQGLNGGGNYIDDGRPQHDVAQSLQSFSNSLSRTQAHETAINAEMDAIEQNMHSIFEEMGIDPATFDMLHDDSAALPETGENLNPLERENLPDFLGSVPPGDEAQLLPPAELASTTAVTPSSGVQPSSGGHLDEVRTASTASSPRMADTHEVDAAASPRSTRSTKRKSDFADGDLPMTTGQPKARKSTRKK